MTAEVAEEVSASYGSTLQHIELLRAKIATLQAAQEQAEDQVIHRAACDYQAGHLSIEELFTLYKWIRERTVGRILTRWNQHMPREAWSQCIRHTVNRIHLHRPDPDGTWRGIYPLDRSVRYPAPGVSVVYVLFDEANDPCYVGSTKDFGTRVDAHRRDGKQFARWMAHPCTDRESAYELEARLLREHLPYLNKRAGR